MIEVEEVASDTSILIPDSADREPTNIGIVAALPVMNTTTFYLAFAVGSKVLFRSELFEPIQFQGKAYLYGKQDQIIAVIED